jgi:hypothetical protein
MSLRSPASSLGLVKWRSRRLLTKSACKLAQLGVATAAGGFGEATLDQGRGSAKQLAEQSLPTHTYILGMQCAAVKQKSMFGHGIQR